MTEQEARGKAHEARGQLALTSEWQISGAEKRLIELPEGFPEQPTRVRDCLAWIVRFINGPFWVDLAIDDASGDVVRVERSR